MDACTTWSLMKYLEKKLDRNYTRMLTLEATPYKTVLYDHLFPISQTIQVRQTKHERGHCCRSKDELISNVLWIPPYGHAMKTYIHQPCADIGYSLEDLPGKMDNRDWWHERWWTLCHQHNLKIICIDIYIHMLMCVCIYICLCVCVYICIYENLQRWKNTRSSEDDFIYWIICQRQMFWSLNFHHAVWVIKWNEKDEKVLKHSISVGSKFSHSLKKWIYEHIRDWKKGGYIYIYIYIYIMVWSNII